MLYGGELPQGGPLELHGRPIADSPPRFGADGARPHTLNPGDEFTSGRGAVPLGAMLPPPNLVRATASHIVTSSLSAVNCQQLPLTAWAGACLNTRQPCLQLLLILQSSTCSPGCFATSCSLKSR
jgi:hypothetical protein